MITIICGKAGTGKSSFARGFAETIKATWRAEGKPRRQVGIYDPDDILPSPAAWYEVNWKKYDHFIFEVRLSDRLDSSIDWGTTLPVSSLTDMFDEGTTVQVFRIEREVLHEVLTTKED